MSNNKPNWVICKQSKVVGLECMQVLLHLIPYGIDPEAGRTRDSSRARCADLVRVGAKKSSTDRKSLHGSRPKTSYHLTDEWVKAEPPSYTSQGPDKSWK